MHVSRRDFMKMTGMSATALLLAERLGPLSAFAQMTDAEKAQIINTVCAVCSGGCAMKAYVKDGRLVELRGNPEDQVAKGILCVKGLSAIQSLYDPDRLKFPMKRTNPQKGRGIDPGFVKISWEEAYALIAEKLNGYKEKYGPESISFISRPNAFAKRLAAAIGTPNYMSHHATCYSTQEVVWRATMTGSGKPWTQDYANSKYILSFGWDMPGRAKNMQTQNFLAAIDRGAKVTVLDPRYSVTASKAQRWIPIKPGTDLAFALAMIHVIVNEELYDKDFVQNLTFGFAQLKDFCQRYTPQWAAQITEVPADTIALVAREFAGNRPAIIATHKRDAAGPVYANSWRLAHAQVILMALVGSLDRPGGHIMQRMFKLPSIETVWQCEAAEMELNPFPKIMATRVDGMEHFPILAATGKASFSPYVRAVLEEQPYPIKAAIVRKHNVLAFPEPAKMVQAMKKLFVVTMDIYPSEMVQMSDVVLPEHHFLEGTGVHPRVYFGMYPQVAIRQPVIKPLYDTKGFGAIIVDLAHALGQDFYFQGMTSSTYINACLGSVGTTVDEIKKSPSGLFGDPKPFEPKTEFNTPSKKIELYSTVFEKHGYDPLPHWREKAVQPTGEYPFYFVINHPPIFIHSTTQNLEYNSQIQQENMCYINTATAEKMGVQDGDYVIVESPVNRVRVKAKLTQGMRPDTVSVDHGFGHWSKSYSRAYGRGSNEGDLIPARSLEEMDLSNPAMSENMSDICVRVYKV